MGCEATQACVSCVPHRVAFVDFLESVFLPRTGSKFSDAVFVDFGDRRLIYIP